MEQSRDLVGFIETHKTYKSFKEYIRALLSTFMPENYLQIYMSEEMDPTVNRSRITRGFPNAETHPAKGPFSIIERAFTHENVTTLNLETLETLGDAVLNAGVVMIIVLNWPVLMMQEELVANMKKYHTNNEIISKYAEQMGFVRWVVRDRKAGLDTKERADVFESFIGALVMIGEFYIGEQMGMAMAQLFLNRFFATQEWHPENPQFYEAAENLWNDWRNSLPESENNRPSKDIAYHEEEERKWTVTLTIRDKQQKPGEKGPLERKCGKTRIEIVKIARAKKDAKSACYRELAQILDLKKTDIASSRQVKQSKNPEIRALIEKLDAAAAQMGKDVHIPARSLAGGTSYAFVKERMSDRIGGRTLKYEKTIASGWGTGKTGEVDAIKMAVENFINGVYWTPVAGTDLYLENPDLIRDAIPVAVEKADKKPVREVKPKETQHKKPQGGRGRGQKKPEETYNW